MAGAPPRRRTAISPPACTCTRNRLAVEHAFSVASGLDSMVLGEAQILGQLKDAYRIAQRGRQYRTLAQQIVPGGLLRRQTRALRDPDRRERGLHRLRHGAASRGACTPICTPTRPHDRCRRDDRADRAAFRRAGIKRTVIANRTLSRAQVAGRRDQGLRGRPERARQGAGRCRHRHQLHGESAAAHHQTGGGSRGACAPPSPHFHGGSGRAARHRAVGRGSRGRLSLLDRRSAAAGRRKPPAARNRGRRRSRCCSRKKWRASWPNRAPTMRDPPSGRCATKPTRSASRPWSRPGACWLPAVPPTRSSTILPIR